MRNAEVPQQIQAQLSIAIKSPPAAMEQMRKVLDAYDLQQSDFKLGDEEFMVIRPDAERGE